MKGIAYAILIAIVSALMFGPIVEMVYLFSEKARIDSSVNICGRLAVMESVDVQEARENIMPVVDIDLFVESFNDTFADSLDLNLQTSDIVDMPYGGKKGTSKFKSANDRHNDFEVTFEVMDYSDYCDVEITTKYKYKTKYLIYVDENAPEFADFNLKRSSRFKIEHEN